MVDNKRLSSELRIRSLGASLTADMSKITWQRNDMESSPTLKISRMHFLSEADTNWNQQG